VAVAKITGQGLAAIAVLVCLLWACLIAERITIRHARAEEARTYRALQRLRSRRTAIPTPPPASCRSCSNPPRITL
jgi:hypothetical protein